MAELRKASHWAFVRVEGGVPVCPDCGDRMVPGPEADTWQCPLGRALADYLAAAMAECPAFSFLPREE